MCLEPWPLAFTPVLITLQPEQPQAAAAVPPQPSTSVSLCTSARRVSGLPRPRSSGDVLSAPPELILTALDTSDRLGTVPDSGGIILTTLVQQFGDLLIHNEGTEGSNAVDRTHQIVKVQKQRKYHLHTGSYICELMLMGLDIMITTAVLSYKINKQLSFCLVIVYFPGLTATELASKRRGVRCKDTSLTARRLCKVANEPLLACYLNWSDCSAATGCTFTDWCNQHQQQGGFIYVFFRAPG